jgi:hypothetical protein
MSINTDIEATLNSQEHKDMILDMVSILTGTKLSYSKDSISQCDEIISVVFPLGECSPKATTIFVFGYLLGQTVINDFGGVWVANGKNILEAKVKIDRDDKTLIIDVFSRLTTYMVQDREFNMRSMYAGVEHVCTTASDIENMLNGITLPDGHTTIRMTGATMQN